MHRVLFLAPVVFVLLTALGFHNAIGAWLMPVRAAGPLVAAPAPAATEPTKRPLAVPTVPLRIDATLLASPTPLPRFTALPTIATVPPTVTAAQRGTPRPTATARSVVAGPRRTGLEAVPKVNAHSYVVVDGESGDILAELNPHMRVAPASTTKIVTALVALQGNSPSEVVTAQYDPSELVDSTLMGLKVGDRVTLEDLLYGLMLPSGNDASLAIATHVAGSKAAFVQRMNQLTAELGLTDSHWMNPHGLDAPGHYSSAYDMVQFARIAMQDPRFVPLASARVRTVHVGGRTYDIYNLNRVLGNIPGADGVKIGYTDDAGRTIVASVTRNGHRIYVGAFHIGDLVADTRPLVEWAFKNWSWGA